MAITVATVLVALSVAGMTTTSLLLPAVLADADLIASTCKSTRNAQSCVAVLSGDPRSAAATTVRDLAGAAVDIARANAVDGHDKMNEILMRNHPGGATELALLSCSQLYADGDLNLENAKDELATRDFLGAEKLAASARDLADRCDDEFAGDKLPFSQVVKETNQKMKDLSDVAAHIVHLLL